jgi:hypothetical protein
MIWTIVFGLFGVIGGLCGIWSLVYVRRQTKLMEEDIRDRKKQDAEDTDWSIRLEKVSNQLRQINPNLMVQEPGVKGPTQVYPTIFPDPKVRVAIETYIVELNPSKTLFLPRSPQPYEFRSPTMRQTIEKAEMLIQKFIQEHPFCKQHLLG